MVYLDDEGRRTIPPFHLKKKDARGRRLGKRADEFVAVSGRGPASIRVPIHYKVREGNPQTDKPGIFIEVNAAYLDALGRATKKTGENDTHPVREIVRMLVTESEQPSQRRPTPKAVVIRSKRQVVFYSGSSRFLVGRFERFS